MKRNAFPKSKRIVSGARFTLVLRRGGCAADGCLVVFALPHWESARPKSAVIRSERAGSAPPHSDSAYDHEIRLGVTIPKKTGNAVTRNQWKRWIREAFRTQQDALPAGFDLVVRPKKGAVGNWDTIRQSLPRLAQKAVRRIKTEATR